MYNWNLNNARPQVGWRLVTPGETDVITVEEAKSHLRIDHSVEDDDIVGLIQVATNYVESRGEILSAQTWDLVLDAFPSCSTEPIKILKRPLQSVEYITYVDVDGVTQPWDTSLYQVAKASRWPRIAPAYAQIYPLARYQMESITIRLNLGYNSSPIDVPRGIIQAMKLLIGHLYENREAVIVLQGVVSLELPFGLEALLDQLIGGARIY